MQKKQKKSIDETLKALSQQLEHVPCRHEGWSWDHRNSLKCQGRQGGPPAIPASEGRKTRIPRASQLVRLALEERALGLTERDCFKAQGGRATVEDS